jgi:hypothetical protein
MEIKDYITKYGRELIDTSWGVMPKWEIKMLLDEGAVEIKNGQAAIKLEPVGFVEDKNDHLITTFYGEPEIIREQYNTYKQGLKGYYHLRIANCPIKFERIMKDIEEYKNHQYADNLQGLNDLDETPIEKIDFMSKDEILEFINK